MDYEAKPPGSICPICGTEDVDIKDGKAKCLVPICGAEFTFRINIETRRWYPTQGMTRFQKVRYYVRKAVRDALKAYEKLWCVHAWVLRTVDAWEEELEFTDAIVSGSLRTVVSKRPPYFVCKHCDKRIDAK